MKLNEIYFKNYLLLGSGKITFSDRFNALTGETGAGKSMLIGIINLLRGDKIAWEKFQGISTPIETSGIFVDKNEEFIVKRNIYPDKKKSRFFINDSPVTRETIWERVGKYIEISSQHQSSTLLNEDVHLDYLDALISLNQEREMMARAFRKLNELKHSLKQKQQKLRELTEKREFLKFKLTELESINVYEGEENELEDDIYRLENIETLRETYEDGIEIFYEGDNSIYEMVSSFMRNYSDILQNDKNSKELLSLMENIMINAEELFQNFKNLRESLDIDPESLEEKRKRLFDIRELMNKYGLATTRDIILEISRLKKELSGLKGQIENIDELKNEINRAEEHVLSLANDLSRKRHMKLKDIEAMVTSELKLLGFPKIKFTIDMKTGNLDERGYDRVRFLLSTSNRNPAPIKHIASGGELSRILLAFKVLSSNTHGSKILVFDEIDTGIGGKTARVVGDRLKSLSENSQIIVITHLPQIASLADSHFLVERGKVEDSTIKIVELNRNERIHEIARMLSGDKITQSAIEHAKTLMEGNTNG